MKTQKTICALIAAATGFGNPAFASGQLSHDQQVARFTNGQVRSANPNVCSTTGPYASSLNCGSSAAPVAVTAKPRSSGTARPFASTYSKPVKSGKPGTSSRNKSKMASGPQVDANTKPNASGPAFTEVVERTPVKTEQPAPLPAPTADNKKDEFCKWSSEMTEAERNEKGRLYSCDAKLWLASGAAVAATTAYMMTSKDKNKATHSVPPSPVTPPEKRADPINQPVINHPVKPSNPSAPGSGIGSVVNDTRVTNNQRSPAAGTNSGTGNKPSNPTIGSVNSGTVITSKPSSPAAGANSGTSTKPSNPTVGSVNSGTVITSKPVSPAAGTNNGTSNKPSNSAVGNVNPGANTGAGANGTGSAITPTSGSNNGASTGSNKGLGHGGSVFSGSRIGRDNIYNNPNYGKPLNAVEKDGKQPALSVVPTEEKKTERPAVNPEAEPRSETTVNKTVNPDGTEEVESVTTTTISGYKKETTKRAGGSLFSGGRIGRDKTPFDGSGDTVVSPTGTKYVPTETVIQTRTVAKTSNDTSAGQIRPAIEKKTNVVKTGNAQDGTFRVETTTTFGK